LFCLKQSLKELSEELLSSLATSQCLPFPPEPFAPWRGAKVRKSISTSKLFRNFFFSLSVPGLPPGRAAKVRNISRTSATFFHLFFPALPAEASLKEAAAKVSNLSLIPATFFPLFFRGRPVLPYPPRCPVPAEPGCKSRQKSRPRNTTTQKNLIETGKHLIFK
ncbi:hypothetical protein, partial [uncultured Pontibacter sp.]|uniref:hypothetical protein n=1 Tax=uncultured Pontibacter sp. TaxID=453356 RepID=UPI0026250965